MFLDYSSILYVVEDPIHFVSKELCSMQKKVTYYEWQYICNKADDSRLMWTILALQYIVFCRVCFIGFLSNFFVVFAFYYLFRIFIYFFPFIFLLLFAIPHFFIV